MEAAAYHSSSCTVWYCPHSAFQILCQVRKLLLEASMIDQIWFKSLSGSLLYAETNEMNFLFISLLKPPVWNITTTISWRGKLSPLMVFCCWITCGCAHSGCQISDIFLFCELFIIPAWYKHRSMIYVDSGELFSSELACSAVEVQLWTMICLFILLFYWTAS